MKPIPWTMAGLAAQRRYDSMVEEHLHDLRTIAYRAGRMIS